MHISFSVFDTRLTIFQMALNIAKALIPIILQNA